MHYVVVDKVGHTSEVTYVWACYGGLLSPFSFTRFRRLVAACLHLAEFSHYPLSYNMGSLREPYCYISCSQMAELSQVQTF